MTRHPLDGLHEDVRDHIERETQDNIDRGMTRGDARDAALRDNSATSRSRQKTIASAGLLLGVAAALAMTRVLTSLLYEVTPTDPSTFAVVVGVLGAAAVAACCGPALKAARIDPIVALRYDEISAGRRWSALVLSCAV